MLLAEGKVEKINDLELAGLREKNVIAEDEVAYIRGDLVVAVNVLSENKRVLGKARDVLAESARRVLKG